MKKLCAWGAAVVVCLLITIAPARGAYKSYSQSSAYLSWQAAQSIYTKSSETTVTQETPHGGYTTTTVKCAVCHSTHRAYSASTKAEAGADLSLTTGNTCVACHASGGTGAASTLVEYNPLYPGPHMTQGSTCSTAGCHGSVHNSQVQSKYATVRRYNLANQGSVAALDSALDAAIASGNVPRDTNGDELVSTKSVDGTPVKAISTESLDQGMKAYVTGYVCYPCHGESSRSVANSDFASSTGYKGHLSVGTSVSAYIPTCEGCHDVVGVETGTTAWPHANRGIDVYVGRFDSATNTNKISTTQRVTTNDDSTRYGLWMTSSNYGEDTLAEPIVGVVANSAADWQTSAEATTSVASQNIDSMLTDGVCLKCHQAEYLR